MGHPIEQGSYVFKRIEPFPKKILDLRNEKITTASCGNNYSVAISNKGELFVWGKGEYSSKMNKEKIPNIMDAIRPI